MEDNRTTMNTPLEEVLKDDFMQEIFVETDDGKAVKTYGKLAGLTNLGKTYFINWNEINKA